MRNYPALFLLALAFVLVITGCSRAAPAPVAAPAPAPAAATNAPVPPTTAPTAVEPLDTQAVAAAFQTGGCGACHVIPGIPNAAGATGPDLSGIGDVAQATLRDPAYAGQAKTAADYIREAIVSPDAFVSPRCPNGVCQKGMMPASLAKTLSDRELDAVVGYLAALRSQAPAAEGAQVMEAAFQRGGCGACHVIPGVANAIGTIGPDLSKMGEVAQATLQDKAYTGRAKTVADYLHEAITSPDAYVSKNCPGGACQKGLMPATLAKTLSDQEINAVVAYLSGLPGQALAVPAQPVTATIAAAPALTPAEFASAKQIFFERCAGCHGTLRKGATGPALTPDKTLVKGTIALSAIIFNGTPRGMPDWGKQGVLTQAQAELMAKFLQNEPPAAPEMSLAQMKETWKVLMPPEKRPTAPQHQRDWQDFFVVTLRDAGQVAIIDGDTFEVVNTVTTGYAVHISRMSATGRYVYVIGRDGKASLIDLWLEKPDVVAEVKTCYDARSIESSKYNGPEGDFSDKYAIVGCYWPPHFVILDGLTLEPFKIVSTRSYTYDTGEYHPEPRVAAIVASHFKPEWIVDVKETGQVWLVNYTDPKAPSIKMLEAERFLHDGGWDSTRRYFLVAANQANKIAVVDAQEGKIAAIVETAKTPHPGRGANWVDPEFGPVWSTSHLGEGSLVAIGTDPEGHPDQAWKVVRNILLPGGGSLFVKSHPNSPWIWVDFGLNPDEKIQRSVCVIAKADPTKTAKCWEVADYGRAVHFEYNKEGTQVWVSVWGRADIPGKTGEIVVYDDKTLAEVARIPDLVTPTGKFNVYNTVKDIY